MTLPKPLIIRRVYRAFFPRKPAKPPAKPPTWAESQVKYVAWTTEKLPEDYRVVVADLARRFKLWSKIGFDDYILDVGCGTDEIGGMSYEEFFGWDDKKIYPNWRGLDPLVGRATEIGCAENMPYRDESFDKVQIATSLDHFTDWEMALRECLRVVKKTGEINIWFTETGQTDPHHPKRLRFIDVARFAQNFGRSYTFHAELWRGSETATTIFMKIKGWREGLKDETER